jgi:hypothetical protein
LDDAPGCGRPCKSLASQLGSGCACCHVTAGHGLRDGWRRASALQPMGQQARGERTGPFLARFIPDCLGTTGGICAELALQCLQTLLVARWWCLVARRSRNAGSPAVLQWVCARRVPMAPSLARHPGCLSAARGAFGLFHAYRLPPGCGRSGRQAHTHCAAHTCGRSAS